jgi:hypothetical protein
LLRLAMLVAIITAARTTSGIISFFICNLPEFA